MAEAPLELRSLRGQFVRILLAVSVLMSIATTSIVVLMSAQASSVHVAAVQGHIQDGIISKGKVLTEQHALALRSLAQDNAFLDMQRLVERAVKADPELVYGLFVDAHRATLALSRHGDGPQGVTLPEKDGWRSLDLNPEELLVRSGSAKRVTRMGRDMLEVAVPVVSEEGEALGTIRYGLSTDRMHEALARAKGESDSRLWRSVLLMIVLVGGVTVGGLVLSRAQAVRITEPIGALRRAAETLASGDRSVRVDIKSGDELALLGMSFNRMVDELNASYGQLEQMNRTLEQKVEARTAELAHKNRDMRLVLDNVDEGLINLSPSGVMAGERSTAADHWFGTSDRAQPFWEYIEPVSAPFASAFRDAWWQVEARMLPIELALFQLPRQLTRGQRAWSFRYLPLPDEGKDDLEGVLIVIADVTERLAREREEAEHGELMQASKRLMRDRNGFSCFLQEATTMINQVISPSDSVDILSLKRTLHTLKGNAAVMGLGVVAQLCHALETQLAENARMEPLSLTELGARWAAITQHVTTFLGASQRVIEVPEGEYAALVSRLSKIDANSEVLKALRSWQLESAAKPLSQLADQARVLARRLGRGEINVIVSADNVRLDPQYWAPFFAELVHLIRNAVDHGLEPPADRVELGKPANGTLALRVRLESDELTFEVSDDGRGIDWTAIIERAKERGLPHSTQAELLDVLCADGVTTRQVASDVSGRGVGMASFRQRLDALSGRIDVQSAKGVGTSWFMRFRWPVDEVESARSRRSTART